MHKDLLTRRRILLVTYRRYLKADRAWDMALRDVKTWLPSRTQPTSLILGNPGSKVRKTYEQRERALMQLEAARLKLETARKRMAVRRQKAQISRIILLA